MPFTCHFTYHTDLEGSLTIPLRMKRAPPSPGQLQLWEEGRGRPWGRAAVSWAWPSLG